MGPALPLQSVVFTLLFRLGVAASIAALIARSTLFQRFLREEKRGVDERLLFVLLYGPPVAIGVLTRILLRYQATAGGLCGGRAGGRPPARSPPPADEDQRNPSIRSPKRDRPPPRMRWCNRPPSCGAS